MAEDSAEPSGSSDGAGRRPLCIWLARECAPWLVQSVAATRSNVLAVGAEERALRTTFGVDPVHHSDLRSFCSLTTELPMLFCGFGQTEASEQVLRGRAVVYTTEPWIVRGSTSQSAAFEVVLPGIPPDGPFASATESLRELGMPTAMHTESFGEVTHGSILARLNEAARLTCAWMGVPNRVSTAVAGQSFIRLGEDRPDSASRSFRLWKGTIAVSCQFPDGRAASIVASNTHPVWSRRAVANGAFGTMTVTDDRLHWISSSGRVVEGGDEPIRACASEPIAVVCAATLMGGEAFERSLGPETHSISGALVEAACLSALTGEPESPLRIARLLVRI